jgi:hypothetical protein
MSQHLYDISNFVPYGLGNCKIVKINNNHVSLNKRTKRLMKTKNFNIVIFRKEKKISEVAEHFNLKGHCKDCLRSLFLIRIFRIRISDNQ